MNKANEYGTITPVKPEDRCAVECMALMAARAYVDMKAAEVAPENAATRTPEEAEFAAIVRCLSLLTEEPRTIVQDAVQARARAMYAGAPGF